MPAGRGRAYRERSKSNAIVSTKIATSTATAGISNRYNDHNYNDSEFTWRTAIRARPRERSSPAQHIICRTRGIVIIGTIHHLTWRTSAHPSSVAATTRANANHAADDFRDWDKRAVVAIPPVCGHKAITATTATTRSNDHRPG